MRSEDVHTTYTPPTDHTLRLDPVPLVHQSCAAAPRLPSDPDKSYEPHRALGAMACVARRAQIGAAGAFRERQLVTEGLTARAATTHMCTIELAVLASSPGLMPIERRRGFNEARGGIHGALTSKTN